MTHPRKASQIINDLCEFGRKMVLRPHDLSDDLRHRLQVFRDEMDAAGAHDPCGRAQFFAEPAILIAMLIVLHDRRLTLQRKEAADQDFAEGWENVVVAMITHNAERAVDAVRYEIAEGVV